MDEESKGIALVLLGIVAVIAIVGLVLLIGRVQVAGAAFVREPIGECREHVTNVQPAPTVRAKLVFTKEQFEILQTEGMNCKLY